MEMSGRRGREREEREKNSNITFLCFSLLSRSCYPFLTFPSVLLFLSYFSIILTLFLSVPATLLVRLPPHFYSLFLLFPSANRLGWPPTRSWRASSRRLLGWILDTRRSEVGEPSLQRAPPTARGRLLCLSSLSMEQEGQTAWRRPIF